MFLAETLAGFPLSLAMLRRAFRHNGNGALKTRPRIWLKFDFVLLAGGFCHLNR